MKSGVERRALRRNAKPSLLALTLAAALSAVVPEAVDAAGLGRLTVQSALGQPLRAEVEITSATRDELDSLAARLAAPDAFQRAGMSFNPALRSLRFAIDRQADGRSIVRITSTEPINEPFVDLLVELNWSSGRFVREYTFLLDPPELKVGTETVEGNTVLSEVTRPSTSLGSPAAGASAAAPVTPAPAAATPASRPTPPPVPAPRASGTPATPQASRPAPPPRPAAPASVTVQRGETLTEIANRVKPADVTAEQAIIAIYNANPRAFFGSVHQLYAGRSLSIPAADVMREVDPGAARRQIRVQAAEFNAYRQRLAGEARKVDTAQAGTSATGIVTARVDERAAPPPGSDQLVLSRTEGAQGAGAGGATGSAGGSAAEEARVAAQAALREQQERVSQLEKNVADLQKLLELKNQQLADLQKQADVARLAAAPGASGQIGGAASGSSPASAQAPTGAPSGAVSQPATPLASPQSTQAGTQPDLAQTQAPAAAQVGTSTPDTTSPAPAARAAGSTESQAGGVPAPATAPAPAPRRTVAPPPPPPPPPSFLDELLASPMLMPGLAAIVIALGGYGWYTVRRRRRESEEQDEGLIAADEFTANSLFGTTGGQSVDTAGPSVFGPTVRDTGIDVHPTEVDPIAEAEVYIAYGREAQAEEILREALRRQPDRQPVRMKLLEILATRKDATAFGAIAGEMFEMTGGVNEEWPRVAALGSAIDPGNPLYEGGAAFGAAGDTAGSDDAYDSFRQSVGADEVPPEPDASMALGVSPPASGEPDNRRREFAETRDMAPETEPDTGAPLDFGLSIDTSIGLPADESSRFARPNVRPDANADDEAAADDGGRSELERAVDGRFDLPTLDFIGSESGSDVDLPGDSRGPSAAGALDDAGRRKADVPEEPPALGDFGEFRVDLPDLDLPSSPASTGGDDAGMLDLSALESGAPGSESPEWQEMATKLDLASAYEEIGDKDGARELLEEVVRDGDPEQKGKARAMLDRLG